MEDILKNKLRKIVEDTTRVYEDLTYQKVLENVYKEGMKDGISSIENSNNISKDKLNSLVVRVLRNTLIKYSEKKPNNHQHILSLSKDLEECVYGEWIDGDGLVFVDSKTNKDTKDIHPSPYYWIDINKLIECVEGKIIQN